MYSYIRPHYLLLTICQPNFERWLDCGTLLRSTIAEVNMYMYAYVQRVDELLAVVHARTLYCFLQEIIKYTSVYNDLKSSLLLMLLTSILGLLLTVNRKDVLADVLADNQVNYLAITFVLKSF